MIKDLVETIKTNKPLLAPLHVWQAYEQLEKVNGSTKNELIALVSLVRKLSGIDNTLTPFDKTVDKNFQDWIFKKQAGTLKYTEEQVQWLRMIKDYIANSFHVDRDDFELDPFNKQGGLGKMWQLFWEQTDEIIELDEMLVAENKKENTYEPSLNATMIQLLRRTLVLKDNMQQNKNR
jgi:type I restriction enzyme, R subunit